MNRYKPAVSALAVSVLAALSTCILLRTTNGMCANLGRLFHQQCHLPRSLILLNSVFFFPRSSFPDIQPSLSRRRFCTTSHLVTILWESSDNTTDYGGKGRRRRRMYSYPSKRLEGKGIKLPDGLHHRYATST